MASFKDSSSSSRPLSQTALPPRHANSRQHSHSISLGAVNMNNRVTRRKSMTSSAANNSAAAAALVAALKESGESLPTPPPHPSTASSSHRRRLSVKKSLEPHSIGSGSGLGSNIARARAGSTIDHAYGRKLSPHAIDENSVGSAPVGTKNRSRRASEGSHLIRGEGKRVPVEVKCERWEHDPAWAYTSKLLISKHQQVQLLEAASVLVNMNEEPELTQDGLPAVESDGSSASPTASGSLEFRNGVSSTETTPPPTGEEGTSIPYPGYSHHAKNYSINSNSAFSRSFQSIPSSSINGSAPSLSPAMSHFRQSSIDHGSSNDLGGLDDDEAGLAAAIELCHFGTPRTGPVPMSPDVPPVPPLPARFLGQSLSSNSNINLNGAGGGMSLGNNPMGNLSSSAAPTFGGPAAGNGGASTPTMFDPLMMHRPLSYKVSDERGAKMDGVEREDEDFGRPVQTDDDDDEIFGRMEE
ncbi:hypothetical protein FQN54_003580 [Arachnomyces sp. PD_36]|nr:hypothetical protein FQN54_003580 [Arachnomyces sp. PD_36]